MAPKETKNGATNIYELLMGNAQKKTKKRRAQLLKSVGAKELFEEGDIRIDKKTCQGVECKICIEMCPTNALYWRLGEIGVVKDLCIYCTACVFSCIVDNCIKIHRRSQDGREEKFSTPRDVLQLLGRINTEKRRNLVKLLFE